MLHSRKAIEIIKRWEGYHKELPSGNAKAYQCPAKVWTIGFGSTHYEDSSPVKEGDIISRERAEELLNWEVSKVAVRLNSLVSLPQLSFDAVVSFCYNCGLGAFQSSTLFKRIKEKDFKEAADEFNKWIYGGGRVLEGLVRRRAEERQLFLAGISLDNNPAHFEIAFGDFSPKVKLFQKMINAWLLSWGKPLLVIDGIYGEATQYAVTDFQGNNNLEPKRGVTVECWNLVKAHYYSLLEALEPDQEFFELGKDSNIQLTQSFHLKEVQCKCSRCRSVRISRKAISKLQELRDAIGKPIYVTSGYRCPPHNEEVGGVSNSRHKVGDAFDIVVSGMTPRQVAEEAERIGFDGVGTYSSFTHVDTRGYKARW